MTALVYPSTLPTPSVAPLTPVERRVLAPLAGPFGNRVFQRDFGATQQITLPPFTQTEAAAFLDWFENALTKGGSWFSANWPLPEELVGAGYASGVRRWIGEPQWKQVRDSGGLYQVSGVVEVRGRGLAPLVKPPVLSQLDFHVLTHLSTDPGGYPTETFATVTEDYKGVNWTLWGHQNPNSYIDGTGHLILQEYQVSGPFSNSVMQSDVIPGLAACDDFTLEVSNDENGVVAYGAFTSAIMIGGNAVDAGTGLPHDTGDWCLISRYNSSAPNNRSIQFIVKTAVATAMVTTATSYTVPHGAGVVREIAVTRTSGVLRLFINGALVATQDTVNYPVDHTALFGRATFAGTQKGAYYLPNNYGEGIYSRWRLTAASLYTASYTPTGSPFPPP